MLKKPVDMSFFAIKANFHFTVRNFTEVKFDKDCLNKLGKLTQPKSIVAISVSASTLYFLLNIFPSFTTLW